MESHPQPRPHEDPFRPPSASLEVICLHCGSEYDSGRLKWREIECGGHFHGCWCCPTPGCQGSGFGFDILPADPAFYEDVGDWFAATDRVESPDEKADEAWEEDWCDEALFLSEAMGPLSEAIGRANELCSTSHSEPAAEDDEGFPWRGAGRDAPPSPGPRLRLYHPPQQ